MLRAVLAWVRGLPVRWQVFLGRVGGIVVVRVGTVVRNDAGGRLRVGVRWVGYGIVLRKASVVCSARRVGW